MSDASGTPGAKAPMGIAKKGCLGCAGVIGVLLLIGSITGIGSKESKSGEQADDSSASAAPVGTPKAPVAQDIAPVPEPVAEVPSVPEPPIPEPVAAPAPIPGIGADLVVQSIRWKVLEVKDLGSTYRPKNRYMKPVRSSGKFIRVKFEAENQGTESKSFTKKPTLMDAGGREYEASREGSIVLDDSRRSCLMEIFNPNLVKTCVQVFEVPKEAEGLQFMANDLEMFRGTSSPISLEPTQAP